MKKSLQNSQLIIGSFILMLTLFISLPTFSATYYSRQSGDWNDVNSWSLIGFGGVVAPNFPGVGDDVIIDRSYIKLRNINVTVSSVLITNTSVIGGTSAQLLISTGKKLSVTNNFDVTAENIAKNNTLKLKNNLSELEIFGNLTFTRTANNVQTYKNRFVLDDGSKVTVHGNYVVDNLNGPFNSILNEVDLNDDATFICKSSVTWNISDLCKHWNFVSDNSTWQIDGDFNIIQNGVGEFKLVTLKSSTLTVNQNLNVSYSNSGVVTLLASGGYSGTPGSVFHVLGNLNVTHPTGNNFNLQTDKTGEFSVDGDVDISWTGSVHFGHTPVCSFAIGGAGELNISKSLTINMDDSGAGVSVLVTSGSEFNIGNNNGLFEESATINMVSGTSYYTNLETNGKFNVFGDFINTINITDDIRFILNQGLNYYTGRTKINVLGNWNIIKNGGDALLISGLKSSDFFVGGNFNVTSTNHEAGNFENEEIHIGDISTFEVGGSFEFNLNDVNQNTNLNIDITNDASMKTGSLSGNATSITLTNGNGISVSLTDNAAWETSGDFKINCLDGASSSLIETNNDAKLIVSNDLVLNNTQNTHFLTIQSLLSSLIDINGDIDMTKVYGQNRGKVSILSNSKLEFGGNFIQNPAPNNYGKLEVVHNGVIEFDGMDAQVIPAKSSAGTDFCELGNVVLNSFSINVPQFTIPEDAEMNTLTVNGLNEIVVASEVSLEVKNTITNNGSIYIENNASLVQTNVGANTNGGTGSYFIKRTGKNVAAVYNVWSSPIQNASLMNAFSGNNACDMYVFQPSDQSWSYDFAAGYSSTCSGNAVTFQAGNVIAGGDGNMDIARGYYIPGSANATRTFTGDVNNGDIQIAVETTALGNNDNWNDDDWNLVGNPYPSALNASAFWTENAVNNARITDGIYYWDDADPNAAANQNTDYAYWNMAGGVSSGNSNKIPNGHIASGQGFWVYANANTNLVFNNAMRSTTNDQFFKQEQVNENHNVWISLATPSQQENNILVGFNPNASDTVDDQFDAHKLEVNPHVYLASRVDSQNFVIQSLALLGVGELKRVPLTLKSDEYGMHTIKAYKKENLTESIVIYIHDKNMGTMHDLAQGDFMIDLNPNQEYTARFELVFKYELKADNNAGNSKGSPSDSTVISHISELNNSEYSTIETSGQLHIVNKSGINGTLQVFDLTGKKMFEQIGGNETSIPVTNWAGLTCGSYVVVIINQNELLFAQQIIKK